MSIATKIEGDPASIRSSADWLRRRLSSSVNNATAQLTSARTRAEAGWEGEASSGFQATMRASADNGDQIGNDADRAGLSFETYADDLQTAQMGMTRAREIAADGGLELTDTHILAPGAAPTAPQALPTDGSATQQMVQDHNAAITAQQEHAKKVSAYRAAADESKRARQIMNRALRELNSVLSEQWDKKYLVAADVAKSTGGVLVGKHVSVLKDTALAWEKEAEKARLDSFKMHGDRAGMEVQSERRLKAQHRADAARKGAAKAARRFGSKIPIIGLGVTAAGVGYDIHSGKPPAKSIVSGLAGAGGAALVGALATNPGGWAVLGGIAVGIGASYAAEKVWEHAVPQEVKDKINAGLNEIGSGIKDAGESIAGGVSDAWNAVF